MTAAPGPSVTTVDYHTAGEPFRIVPEPPLEIPGASVAEKRMAAIADAKIDGLRRLLCFEPRGHADMYGGFITDPDDAGAHFGVLFWHKDGFSTACGHGTIALGTWAVESGRVPVDPSSITEVVIDVPSGRVTAAVHTDDSGRVSSVDFINVPGRLIAADVEVEVEAGADVEVEVGADIGVGVPADIKEEASAAEAEARAAGTIPVDLIWGGAIYACVDGDALGLQVAPENLHELIELGRSIKAGLADHPLTAHPGDDRLSGVYGAIIVNRLGTLPGGELHQRNVTIFADGQVDRSPCGSGTAARIAALHSSGELADGHTLIHESIIGTRFRARVLSADTASGAATGAAAGAAAGRATGEDTQEDAAEDSREDTTESGVVPIISASAHKVATCTFEVDDRDDLVPGFVLR
ncbi:proline racemase family protein [Brevibacterium sp. GP-SGM9]|uniref:proline racemase family protein n=1 Tax=Brevibacterium sp. GP-SGM9 TaxID=3376990 RepID=UPI0039A71242